MLEERKDGAILPPRGMTRSIMKRIEGANYAMNLKEKQEKAREELEAKREAARRAEEEKKQQYKEELHKKREVSVSTMNFKSMKEVVDAVVEEIAGDTEGWTVCVFQKKRE